jgi:hypothetical protein
MFDQIRELWEFGGEKKVMINTIEQFGRNAGIVWNLLSEEAPLAIDEIVEKTNLRMYETEIAIGWLARENKISQNNGKYQLEPTNLTETIGGNAGMLWNILFNQKTLDLQSLIEQSALPTQEFYKAVGWLAKEDKIKIDLR